VGRVCRGVELDPRYIDVVIRRYEAITRRTAIRANTGEPFATLVARKRNVGDARSSRKIGFVFAKIDKAIPFGFRRRHSSNATGLCSLLDYRYAL
jgi:hypothetical protein